MTTDSKVFTPERIQRLREFWPQGLPLQVIASEFNCTTGWISAKAHALGLTPRQQRGPRPIGSQAATLLDSEARRYFWREAKRRGLTWPQLEAALLRTIIADRMVDAVLDDSD